MPIDPVTGIVIGAVQTVATARANSDYDKT